MRNILRKFRTIVGLAYAVVAMTSFSASAASCAAIDYAELQDMDVAELVKDICLAFEKSDDNIMASHKISLRSLDGERTDEAAQQMLITNADQCRNQAERMRKMLVRKGVEASSTTHKILCSPK